MKRILIPSILCIAFYACNSSNANRQPRNRTQTEQEDTANFTNIQWIDSVKNFGTAKYGDKVNVQYIFKNTGDKPLYILDVRPTCGCTVADYTKSAVMPGKEGNVNAVYDTKHGVPGSVAKSIVVSSNTKNDTHFVLAFKGEVVK